FDVGLAVDDGVAVEVAGHRDVQDAVRRLRGHLDLQRFAFDGAGDRSFAHLAAERPRHLAALVGQRGARREIAPRCFQHHVPLAAEAAGRRRRRGGGFGGRGRRRGGRGGRRRRGGRGRGGGRR